MGGLGARAIVGFVQAVLSREPAILETLGKRDVAAVRGENLPGKRLKGAEGTYLLLNVVALQHRLLQDVLGPAARVRRSGRGCAYTSLTLLRRSVCDSVETTRTATRSARRRRMTNVSTNKCEGLLALSTLLEVTGRNRYFSLLSQVGYTGGSITS